MRTAHAPMPHPPRRQHAFAGLPLANQLTSEFDQTYHLLQALLHWAGISLNSDGSLRPDAVKKALDILARTPSPRDAPGVLPVPARPGVPYEFPAADPTALAQDWAEVAVAWAEHMPDTIPPDVLAITGISGDHWSSRWWANQASQIVSRGIPIKQVIQLVEDPYDQQIFAPTTYVSMRPLAPSNSVQIMLMPTDPGYSITIKDTLGICGAYPFRVVSNDGSQIDGQDEFIIGIPYQSQIFVYDGLVWGVNG